MGHSNVWSSHPKNYGPGSRTWYEIFPHTLFSYQEKMEKSYALVDKRSLLIVFFSWILICLYNIALDCEYLVAFPFVTIIVIGMYFGLKHFG